jgi:hypothetical protein
MAVGFFKSFSSQSPREERRETLVSCYAAVSDPGSGEGWPERLLPFCELNRSWACVDCRSDRGLVVVGSGDDSDPFVTNDRNLDSWFRAALNGVDLSAEMFEAAEVKSLINPFTKGTETRTVHGRPRGRRWP